MEQYIVFKNINKWGVCDMKKINLNDTIKVKLTPLGADIYYRQYDDFIEQMKRENNHKVLETVKPRMPRIDKDGFTEIQFWHFIQLYGEYTGIAKQDVIEGCSIYVNEGTLEDI